MTPSDGTVVSATSKSTNQTRSIKLVWVVVVGMTPSDILDIERNDLFDGGFTATADQLRQLVDNDMVYPLTDTGSSSLQGLVDALDTVDAARAGGWIAHDLDTPVVVEYVTVEDGSPESVRALTDHFSDNKFIDSRPEDGYFFADLGGEFGTPLSEIEP